MKLKLKAFVKKAYLFNPDELADAASFKEALLGSLELTWFATDEDVPLLSQEGLAKVKEWMSKLTTLIDGLPVTAFPIDENRLELLVLESSDVWDDIARGDYQSTDELFQSLYNSIQSQEQGDWQ